MCRRHASRRESRVEPQLAYEGETARLDMRHGAWGAARRASSWRRFPWWTLWLLWPLMSLAVRLVPQALDAFSSAVTAIGAMSGPILPILLIAIGIILLRRK